MDPTVLCAYPFEYDNNVRIRGMYLDNWGLSGTLPYSLGLYIYCRTFKSRKVYSVILIKINQYIKQFSHTEKNRTLEMLDNPKSPVGCTYACAQDRRLELKDELSTRSSLPSRSTLIILSVYYVYCCCSEQNIELLKK